MRLFITISFCCLIRSVTGQPVYSVNDKVKDIHISTVLNGRPGLETLKQLSSELTILDFFGTWCIPCIKALPVLSDLKSIFKDRLSIILISNEQQSKLAKFIEQHQPFIFPVIADEQNRFTQLFSPPSYPYTVILDKSGTIVAITDGGSLTENVIMDLLSGKKFNGESIQRKLPVIPGHGNLTSSNKLVQLSQEFMYASKTGENTDSFVDSLRRLEYEELVNKLRSDNEKKAFWINLYNAYTQVLLKQDPSRYDKRGNFFKTKQIEIAGHFFSLDNIEHEIIRRSKIKWSLGHLNKLFPGKIEKDLRVDKLDYRIHFALNCGAKSCPPIAFYSPENLNPQLESATYNYLKSEAEYDAEKNILHLPAIMGWFRRDFGGKKKMIRLLKERQLLPVDVKPKIRFKDYDWTLFTDNYKN